VYKLLINREIIYSCDNSILKFIYPIGGKTMKIYFYYVHNNDKTFFKLQSQKKELWFSYQNKQNVDTLKSTPHFQLNDCPTNQSQIPLFEFNKDIDLDHLSINILAALNMIAKESKQKNNNLEICSKFNDFKINFLIEHLEAMKEFDIIDSIISYVKPSMLVFKI
jgi:hypothetical protein